MHTALWNSPAARAHELANVVLFTQMGFSEDPVSQRGLAHVVEHLLATGPGDASHFNGFTSDSVTAVYSLCRADEVEEVTSMLTIRATSNWVSEHDIRRESRNVAAETAYHRFASTGFEPMMIELGFNSSAGALLDRLELDAVHEWMATLSRRSVLGLFDPTRSSRCEVRLLEDEERTRPSGDEEVRSLRWKTNDATRIVWSFDADVISEPERIDLAVAFRLIDGYLQKYGGNARVGFIDDFGWWHGRTWAGIQVPSAARVNLAHARVRTVDELRHRVARANPNLTIQTRQKLTNGPEWLRHPVVREIIREISLSVGNLSASKTDSTTMSTLWETRLV